jgi:hypothetical protein
MTAKRSAWSSTRRTMYKTQRLMGDVSAASRGPLPLGRRLVRRRLVRATFRLFR